MPCPSDLIVILCRGSHSVATQLRVIPSCEPSFLRSASGTWVDFLGANSCGPITSYLPWGWIHARGSPLVMALLWAVSVPGSPSGGTGISRVRISSSGARLMALKPPFSSSYYCSVWSRLEASRAMSFLGVASLGRCLSEAMTRAISLLTSLPRVPLGAPPCVDSNPWSTPEDGTVHKPPQS